MGRTVQIRQERAGEEGLYERDFYAWTQEQAELLRSGHLEKLDVANVLEEIETLGRSERASLKSAYRLISSHLLKMMFQPELYSNSWYDTVDRERAEVGDILGENPGLKPSREDIFAKAYAIGRKDASRETRLPLDTFPETSPFTLTECESVAFIPDEVRDRVAERTKARAKRKSG